MRGNWRQKFSKSKYRNIKSSFNDLKFDSIGEMEHYKVLLLMEAANEIVLLGCQEKIYLSDSKILYKPDFTVYDIKKNETYWIDYKGVSTAAFQLKKRLWKSYGPGRLQLVRGPGLKFKILEEIISVGGICVGKKEISGSKTKSKKS
jgi:hypothetical protein